MVNWTLASTSPEQSWSWPKWVKVKASSPKPWPNGVVSRPKYPNCVYLRVSLAMVLKVHYILYRFCVRSQCIIVTFLAQLGKCAWFFDSGERKKEKGKLCWKSHRKITRDHVGSKLLASLITSSISTVYLTSGPNNAYPHRAVASKLQLFCWSSLGIASKSDLIK